ncbi:unnamed protein product [Pneumocystis jirovecii]|uniref:Uncharacterized protein n=1 Tax=Pneumocystis jirovecii TaxID=42068 RepID=L0P7H4_PNEJI|nr:unnamed protein product [Pneumocystis jirovecii]
MRDGGLVRKNKRRRDKVADDIEELRKQIASLRIYVEQSSFEKKKEFSQNAAIIHKSLERL